MRLSLRCADKGVSVEYLVAPDEGHGFARPINNLAMVRRDGAVFGAAP